MEQRISLITLGVSDLQRAVTFYERVLGWKAAPSPPAIAFFDLNGVVFSLYPHHELAKDMQSVPGDVGGYRGFALAHNVQSKAEVDSIFALLKQHGATIVKEPQEAFWGEDTPAIFLTLTVTNGRWPSTPTGRFRKTGEFP